MKKLMMSIGALLAVPVLLGCNYKDATKTSSHFVTRTSNVETNLQVQDSTANIVSFGDTLVHSQVFESAYDSELEDYDFSPIFEYVADEFQNATVVIGNCEVPFAGKERGYSGYPCFNSPSRLADNLSVLGVDILTTANNHCLDKGFSGLCSTLDYMDLVGIRHTGTSRTLEEQNQILMKDLNGIHTAFLSFTYGTNGIPLPKDKTFCVNLIDKDFMLNQINQAKMLGAEAIIVSMHWGVEYQTKENKEQQQLAEFLIENDVNIVLGCHPHVLQPMKMVSVTSADGTQKEGLVIYSQGNFFSAQKKENTRNTAIFNVSIKKSALTSKVTVEKASYTPLYLYDYKNETGTIRNRYKLLDLEDIINSYESGSEQWSKSMYDLAIKESNKCYTIIGPEIDNTIIKSE